MKPQIEFCDLAGELVEGRFRINSIAARLALQMGLPYETIRARIVEAYGYCVYPPKAGAKTLVMQYRLSGLDELAIIAMRRVIYDFVSAVEVDAIRKSYLASDEGDAHWIAWDLQTHLYIVIAVLRNLDSEGRLPRHESWG